MTAEQFVRAELEQTGKSSYTLEDVERLVLAYREAKAAAEPFAIDALLGISHCRTLDTPAAYDGQGAAQETRT